MKIHLNEDEIKQALTEKYVMPLIDFGEPVPSITVELKATRGVEGMTCDIVVGTDHSDKPLGIQKTVETARAANALEPHVEQEVASGFARNTAQKPAESNEASTGTEQPVEAPKRRGRPPGSKNKATLEAEAQAASNDTASGPAPEEVAESMQDEERPEPTPYVKSGGLFSNRVKEEPKAEDDSPIAEDELSEEEQLAAEAKRTEPTPEPEEEPAPKPTRSLFGNMNRSQS